MTRRISSSRPMTGSSLPRAGLGGQVAAVLLERLVRPLGVRRRHALAAADALRAPGGAPRGPPRGARAAAALAADLGDRRGAGARSRRTRRRAAAPPPRRARGPASRAGRGSASRPGSGRAGRGSRPARRGTPGRSTPSRRSVSAGMPSSGSTSAARRCSASRIGLSRRSAVRWAATIASWAFWVKRSSCIGVLRGRSRVSGGRVGRRGRGSGRAAVSASSDRPVGRTTRDLRVQVARAVAAEAGHALAGQPERPAVLGPGRDRQEDPALERRRPGPRRRGAPPRG